MYLTYHLNFSDSVFLIYLGLSNVEETDVSAGGLNLDCREPLQKYKLRTATISASR